MRAVIIISLSVFNFTIETPNANKMCNKKEEVFVLLFSSHLMLQLEMAFL